MSDLPIGGDSTPLGRQEKNCSIPMLMLSPPGASGVPVVLEKSQTNKWEQVEQVQQV